MPHSPISHPRGPQAGIHPNGRSQSSGGSATAEECGLRGQAASSKEPGDQRMTSETREIVKEQPVRSWKWLLESMCVTALYAALAIWLLSPAFDHPTYTLPTAPRGTFALWPPDVNLITWVISWDWHALTTAPTRLFDANVFYPAPLALASSEHMLGHVPIFGPIYALSGNPIFAHQMNLLLAFALSGAAMYLLVRHWRGTRGAAFFAGFVYAFYPMRCSGLGNSHLMANQYLPLGLLFLDRTLVEEKLRLALACGLCLLLEALCSYYLLYMTLTALGGYLFGVLWVRRGRVPLRGALLLGVTAFAVGAIIVALTLPYLKLRQAGVIPAQQSEGWLTVASAHWQDYVYPKRWADALRGQGRIYVGLLPALCVLVAVWKDRRGFQFEPEWALAGSLGLTVACYVMAMGPQLGVFGRWVPLPYSFAEHWVPGFSSMRAPVRFGLVFMCGFAALVGLGCSRLLLWLRNRGVPAWASLVVVVLLTAATAWEYDPGTANVSVRTMHAGANAPAVYQQLAREPAGAVLEIPAGQRYSLTANMSESIYMVYSTTHWHPLLNGYSGYRPPSYDLLMALARSLPDAHAVELLQRLAELRYVVVHESLMAPYERKFWARPPGLRLVGTFSGEMGIDLLFETEQAYPADLKDALLNEAHRTTTLQEAPLEAVAPIDQKAQFFAVTPLPSVWSAGPLPIDVVIRNRGRQTWPVLAVSRDHVVTLATRWETPTGKVLSEDTEAAPLPYDVAPEQIVRVKATIRLPPYVGSLRLRLGLAQDGRWFADTAQPVAVTLQAKPQRQVEAGQR